MKRVTLLFCVLFTSAMADASSAPRDQGCSLCARPEIDWQRYVNVAYNTYFVEAEYFRGSVRRRLTGGQLQVKGSSGCHSPNRDWVLVDFRYEWDYVKGGVQSGPFRGGINIPYFTRDITWTAQLPNGSQRYGQVLANSPPLSWNLRELPYPGDARNCRGGTQKGNAVSVHFPWGDRYGCRNLPLADDTLRCAKSRGYECSCGTSGGHYTCIMPHHRGQPMP